MEISEFFKKNKKVAVGFSGGVDSAYLLYAAVKNNADVTAYFVKTQFQPEFELRDAERLAEQLGVTLKIIELDILSDDNIKSNSPLRCYYCKKRIFTAVCSRAKEDGYSLVLDGTNASDDVSDRPGTVALEELSVCSPLRECGLTKDKIRELSRLAGLFTRNKPAYACLATRIAVGEVLTEEKLLRTERAEDFLSSLGFSDFRVRTMGESAKIQVKKEQFPLLFENISIVNSVLKENYQSVLIDTEGR